MDAKIRLEEARAAAALEVNEHLSLEDKFADLEDDGEVSSQLADLKARMGMLPGGTQGTLPGTTSH